MNLQLSLKKIWYDLTDTDGKSEDYRKQTPYFYNKLCLYDGKERSKKFWQFAPLNWVDFDSDKITFKPFTHNIMTLGYPSKDNTSRIKIFEHAGIEIGYGKPEWGAETGKLYFVIKHGKRLQ